MDRKTDETGFPGVWKIGDKCRMITDKKKKLTSEYEILDYDGRYYLLKSNTGRLHRASPGRLFHTQEEAVNFLMTGKEECR